MAKSFIGSILVATDLSPASDRVVEAAGELAACTGARLHFIHIFEFDVAAYGPPPEPTFRGNLEAAKRTMAEQIRRIVKASARVESTHVLIDSAHKAVLWHAKLVCADLIVIGPHRRRRMLEEVLGTTADRVLRRAAIPCLVVRRALPVPLRRVLAPVDFSAESRGALQIATLWARELGKAVGTCKLEVMHVVPKFMEQVGVGGAAARGELHEDVRRAVGRRRIPIIETVVRGDPAKQIVRHSRSADLIVLGTHGAGSVERVLLGSVASAVARSAAAPVLFVPTAYASKLKRRASRRQRRT
jgi:universal stress protein E